jgi:hypothetical protein
MIAQAVYGDSRLRVKGAVAFRELTEFFFKLARPEKHFA